MFLATRIPRGQIHLACRRHKPEWCLAKIGPSSSARRDLGTVQPLLPYRLPRARGVGVQTFYTVANARDGCYYPTRPKLSGKIRRSACAWKPASRWIFPAHGASKRAFQFVFQKAARSLQKVMFYNSRSHAPFLPKRSPPASATSTRRTQGRAWWSCPCLRPAPRNFDPPPKESIANRLVTAGCRYRQIPPVVS